MISGMGGDNARTLSGVNADGGSMNLASTECAIRIEGDCGSKGYLLGKNETTNKLDWVQAGTPFIPPNSIIGEDLNSNIGFDTTASENAGIIRIHNATDNAKLIADVIDVGTLNLGTDLTVDEIYIENKAHFQTDATNSATETINIDSTQGLITIKNAGGGIKFDNQGELLGVDNSFITFKSTTPVKEFFKVNHTNIQLNPSVDIRHLTNTIITDTTDADPSQYIKLDIDGDFTNTGTIKSNQAIDAEKLGLDITGNAHIKGSLTLDGTFTFLGDLDLDEIEVRELRGQKADGTLTFKLDGETGDFTGIRNISNSGTITTTGKNTCGSLETDSVSVKNVSGQTTIFLQGSTGIGTFTSIIPASIAVSSGNISFS
jgi:hypothetical protein